MKKFLFLLLIIPLMSLTTENDTSQFIGKWKGNDDGEIGYIIFDNEGYATLEAEGELLGGKEFEMDGKKMKMTYEINNDTIPIHVDLIVAPIEGDEMGRLLCIANFISNDTMEFAIDFEGKRPIEFNSENSIIFERENNKN